MFLRVVLCLSLLAASTVPAAAAAGRARSRAAAMWSSSRRAVSSVAPRRPMLLRRGKQTPNATAAPNAPTIPTKRPGIFRRIVTHRVVDGGYSYNTLALVNSLIFASHPALAGIALGLASNEPLITMGGGLINLALMPILNTLAESMRNATRTKVE
jgi:hypothetical protein